MGQASKSTKEIYSVKSGDSHVYLSFLGHVASPAADFGCRRFGTGSSCILDLRVSSIGLSDVTGLLLGAIVVPFRYSDFGIFARGLADQGLDKVDGPGVRQCWLGGNRSIKKHGISISNLLGIVMSGNSYIVPGGTARTR